MTTSSHTTHTIRRLAASIVVAVLLLMTLLPISSATAAQGGNPGKPVAPPSTDPASTPDPAAGAAETHVDPDAAAAMAKQDGISVSEATKRLGQQQSLGNKGRKVEKSLAGRSGGSYLDDNGQLVVTTLDPAGDALARRNGARAQRVDDSSARLDNITRQLDRQAARGGAGGVQGWYVDVPNNTVVVTVTEGAKDSRTQAMTKLVNKFGASVRIERAPAEEAPQTTAYLVGGFQFITATGGSCSIGFNARDSYGQNVVLTAGHCVTKAGTMTRNNYWIGQTRTANYPADDFGTFWNAYPSYWVPSVSVYKYNGTYVNVRGQWNTPPIGATVCKSGRTTGYTCGKITAFNQSVTYTGGILVSGLVRHTACVERGDSGGSNISAGAYALGVTSGASMTSGGLCKSKVGRQNVSWYQPVGEALSRNGLSLVYQP